MKLGNPAAVAAALKSAQTIRILPHVTMDGDAFGSAIALTHGLKALGKEALIVLEDKIPDNLAFLADDTCVQLEHLPEGDTPDVTLCIDCGDKTRFPKRTELYARGLTKICVDHHHTSEAVGDINYVDSDASATAELVHDILNELKVPMDQAMAAGLFAAITTDTGNFQYSNTTPKAHRIVADLMEQGFNHYPVSVELYEQIPARAMKLQGMMLDSLQIFAGGRAAMGKVTQDMLRETGAIMEDGDGVSSWFRSIQGVEISAVLKEQEDGDIKASLRAKQEADVAAIAAKFGGGGHVRAAGCTLKGMTMDEAWQALEQAITEALA